MRTKGDKEKSVKSRSYTILMMGALVLCLLAVPAMASDGECGACFGAMPPEITEMPTPVKEENVSIMGVEVEVIWEDYFSTDPFSSGRWYLWSDPQWKMGWDGDSVYLPYRWWVGDTYYYTCAQTMYHSFGTSNPFYGYYNPRIQYTFKSYSDNGQDAGFQVCFAYKDEGNWYGSCEFYHSPEEYSSWTTKNLNLPGGLYWIIVTGDEYRVTVYEDADYSHYPHYGDCDPWSEVKGHVYITCIKLIGTPNKHPYKPSNPSPADGATGISTTTDLSWTGGDPNGADTVKYNVYLGTSPTALNLTCENVLSTTCDPGTLDVNKIYYWKVIARDEFGLTNESDTWSFSTFIPTPTLISPTNGSIIWNPTPTLKCSNVSGDYKYEFQVDDDSNFTSPQTQGFAGPTGDTEYVVGTDGDGYKLLAVQTYWWHARACKEGVGCGSWSEAWYFTTSLFADSLEITSPGDGDRPQIYKDDEGNSYFYLFSQVIPNNDTSPGCLVKVHSPSDKFLGEWCTDRALSKGKPYSFTLRVYVDNANVTLTGETTLRAYWMRGGPREVSTTVTVNLPSNYSKIVCGWVGDRWVCLTPEDIETLKEMKAEAERQMARADITDEALSTLNDLATAIELLLELEEHPGAKIAAKAGKALTILQSAHQTKETGGSFGDFVKRCINSLATGTIPFLEHVLERAWEVIRWKEYTWGPYSMMEGVPAVGFMEDGVEVTGKYLPVNYYRDWMIGPYISICPVPISGIMVDLDYVYMGPGDYFTIYEGCLIPVWESTPGVRHKDLRRPIHDTIGRIIVDCDDSGADSYGYRFDPECPLYLLCHHAEYYNSDANGTHLVKFGTEPTEINFSWGAGSPYSEVNADNFVAVWSGQIYIPGNDTYTFYIASENGTVDARINRTELFSNCIFDDPAEANNSTYLFEGWRNFVIWYHHTTGNASFVLSWKNSTMNKQVVPDDNMRTARTELASLPLTAFFSYKIPDFGTNVSFTDLSFGDNITEWEWDFGDGTPVETYYNRSVNPFHNYSSFGVYNASLTVTNSTGGTSTYSEVVRLYLLPVYSEPQNFDFESDYGWLTETIGRYAPPAISNKSSPGHNGTYCGKITNKVGWSGKDPRAGYIFQALLLPRMGEVEGHLGLSYYVKFWKEKNIWGGEPGPLMGVRITDLDGNVLEEIEEVDGINESSSDWVLREINLTPYAGKIIIIKIYLEDLSSHNGYSDHHGWIAVDDFWLRLITPPPVAIPKSDHRYNNVGSKYPCTTYLNGSQSYDTGGYITEYKWDFGDGEAGYGETVGHIYSTYKWIGSSSGHYEPFDVSLTVKDNEGNSATNSTNVNVYIAGDANGDGIVDIFDAVIVGLEWDKKCNGGRWTTDRSDQADLNNDCIIDIFDAVIIGANWEKVAW